MSLKLMSEGHLHCITKHSVVIVVPLAHCLIIDVMMLVKEVVCSDVEVEQNLLDINDSSMFCMLLTDQQCLLSK